MSWEVAIVASVLGTAFLLIFLAKSIEGTSIWHQGQRLFLIMGALFMILVNSGIPFHLVQNANDTQYGLNHTFAGLNGIANTNIKITMVIVTTFMFIFFVWLLWVVIGYFGGESSRWR